MPDEYEASGAVSAQIPMVALSQNVTGAPTQRLVAYPADIAAKCDLMSHEGFALWSLHIEDGMSTILEDVPISDFKRPIVPSDDNSRGVRTRWSVEQQALHDEQIFRYDSVSSRVYSWLKRQIVLTDVDATHVAKHFQAKKDGFALYYWIMSHHTIFAKASNVAIHLPISTCNIISARSATDVQRAPLPVALYFNTESSITV